MTKIKRGSVDLIKIAYEDYHPFIKDEDDAVNVSIQSLFGVVCIYVVCGKKLYKISFPEIEAHGIMNKYNSARPVLELSESELAKFFLTHDFTAIDEVVDL